MLFELVSEGLFCKEGVFEAFPKFGVLFVKLGVVLFGDVGG